MADYKDIFKGTLSTLGSKAKNYVESGALKDAYARKSTLARCYADIAKLNLRINGALEEQNKIFAELGRLCYDGFKGTPEGKYKILFDELSEIDAKIEAMREELDAVKSAVEASKYASREPNNIIYIEEDHHE